MSKLSEKIEKRLPSKLINRIEGLASRTEEIYDENSSWGPFYQSSKDIASTIAAELWEEILRLRGALEQAGQHHQGMRSIPGGIIRDALSASIQRFGESKKGE